MSAEGWVQGFFIALSLQCCFLPQLTRLSHWVVTGLRRGRQKGERSVKVMLTRRDMLQQAGTLQRWRRRHPGGWYAGPMRRGTKNWSCGTFRPGAAGGQDDQEQCYAYAKQAGIKESEIDYSRLGTGPIPAQAGSVAGGGNPPDITRVGLGSCAALSRPGPPAGGDRRGGEDAETAGGLFPGLPQYGHA